jgi:uncharacterized protein (TIGR02145 family)
MLPLLGFGQINSQGEIPMGGTTTSGKMPLENKRNAQYNLEEIKVRWKKAALENCNGVPCISAPTAPAFTCGTTISDFDGNSYPTVLIGTQCWTKENLKATKYNDGTPIHLDETGGIVGTSTIWQNLTTGSYIVFENRPNNGRYANSYGFLYNWYAAAGIVTTNGGPTKNLCPKDWHVPTDGEWTSLIQFIDPTATTIVSGTQSTIAGGKMKSTDFPLWNTATPPSLGTNDFGFTARAGGNRDEDGTLYDIGNYANFWSASANGSNASSRSLNNRNSNVERFEQLKSFGYSVRCLKD